MIRIPVLRSGQPYTSLDVVRLDHVQTGEPVAEVSQANAGLVARDLLQKSVANRQALEALSTSDLLEICRRAAGKFTEEELPVGESPQSPDDYVKQLSGTTGMPEALCRGNMAKIRYVLENMVTVLAGLTRGLDLSVLDAGWNRRAERPVSYLRQADMLGAVLPGNSPGVHALWIPAVAMKVPLILRPGRREPWTPCRISQALMASGCPPDAFCYYPGDHAAATEILLRSHRSLMFGDASTVAPWKNDRRVELHGPRWRKVILAPDQSGRWREHLDLMATSIAENGGRSCVNASGVRVAEHGREIAEALAARLAEIEALPLDDPRAALAAFPEPALARRISDHIDGQLEIPGAEDLTARVRGSGRVVERDGLTFVLPTLVWCERPDHPLVATELLFPFASVVEVPAGDLLERLGPTLVGTVLTEDERFARSAMACRQVERLNLGSLPTSRVSWEQPHEGNLFTHLYRRRAFQTLLEPGADAA